MSTHFPSRRLLGLRKLVAFSSLASIPLLGCAGTLYPPSAPAVVFPTRAEIAQIPAKPPVAEVFGTKDVAVDEWSVASPPLPSDGPYDDPSPWGTLLRDLTKGRAASVTLSPALRCTAAEIGRFHLEKKALPVERLRRFILARCGGETANLSPFVWFADAPSAIGDDQIIARAREALANGIEEALANGHHQIGLAAARDGKRVAVVVAIGEDEARLEPGPRSIDATRHVTLRGAARGEYAHILGLVNRGDFGVSHCESDPRVRPPRFALTCEVAPGDPFDWVEVLGEKRGHVLLHVLADVLVYDGDPSAVSYKAKPYGPPAPVTTPADFTQALVARVNAVRKNAKMTALSLAAKQSAENERLSGTLLDAAAGRDEHGTADKAAIGLLAGWDVEGGMIRAGEFFLGVVAPSRDAMTWLESAVERPSGRLAFLDPEARLIAVGPSIPEGATGLGAAVTTYSLFESDDHTGDETHLLRRIDQARSARGLPPATHVQPSGDMREAVARVLRDQVTPRGALNEILASAASESNAGAYGFVLETNDLTSLDVPDVFLRTPHVSLALAVTHHRAPGAAWGQYAVFILLTGASSAPTLEARGATPRLNL